MNCEVNLLYSDARKFVIEWHTPCGSFAVESESIGMDNVRFVQKVFLTRTTVKHIRSSADTDKSVRRVVGGRPEDLFRSRILGPRACERSVSGRFPLRSQAYLCDTRSSLRGLPLPLKRFLECPLTAPVQLTPLSARSISVSAPLGAHMM